MIAYDSLGYYEMMNSIFQSLTNNPNYNLDPVEKSWAMQCNKELEQKRKRQKTVKSKGIDVLNKKQIYNQLM